MKQGIYQRASAHLNYEKPYAFICNIEERVSGIYEADVALLKDSKGKLVKSDHQDSMVIQPDRWVFIAPARDQQHAELLMEYL